MKTLLLLLFASPVLAAPRIDNLSVKPDSQKSEVEIVVSVAKGGVGTCEARVDFGDGKGRTVDFGLATIRTLKYTYPKGGDYKVAVKGTGRTPCEGAKEAPVKVAGAPAQKKAAEKKKAEKKKADKKSASAKKKEEPK